LYETGETATRGKLGLGGHISIETLDRRRTGIFDAPNAMQSLFQIGVSVASYQAVEE
jgi:hypothetical protein